MSRLPRQFTFTLSVIWLSCMLTVMADEDRWRQYTDASKQAYQRGDYAEAVRQAQFALKEAEDFGEHDPRLAYSLDSLALLYKAQGHYDKSELLYKRALAVREKALGPDHPDVSESLRNLALLYTDQGRFEEALPMLTRAFQIYRPVAAEHELQIRKEALEIAEKELGPSHPGVLPTLNDLAMAYVDGGRYAEAEPLLKRALAIREKVLPADHLDIVKSLDDLAGVYYQRGRYAEAESLLKRALRIQEKALGPGHPEVATTVENLAELYRAQGQERKAKRLLRKYEK